MATTLNLSYEYKKLSLLIKKILENNTPCLQVIKIIIHKMRSYKDIVILSVIVQT